MRVLYSIYCFDPIGQVHSVTKIKVAAVCSTTTGKPEPMSAFMGLGPIPIMPRGQNPVYLQQYTCAFSFTLLLDAVDRGRENECKRLYCSIDAFHGMKRNQKCNEC